MSEFSKRKPEIAEKLHARFSAAAVLDNASSAIKAMEAIVPEAVIAPAPAPAPEKAPAVVTIVPAKKKPTIVLKKK